MTLTPALGTPSAPAGPGVLLGLIVARLARLRYGRLKLVLPGGGRYVFVGTEAGPSAELRIRRRRLGRRLALGGGVGLAEAYVDGDWDSPDLPALLEVLARNEAAFAGRLSGMRWPRLIGRARHLLNRNTRAGARRNIAAHYDLSNDFYATWLDPGMTYSGAVFADTGQDLAAAQAEKFRRIAALAGLRPGTAVLEIGCGWGGFAEYAARAYGCRVTAITLSRAQCDYARRRIRAAGLNDRVDIRVCDYRDMEDRYDAVVSMEMIEAVGEAYWPMFFDKVRNSLKPGGRAALQAITMDEARWPRYRGGADFIQKYVFPGGLLPPVSALRSNAAAAGLLWQDEASYGMDYARTLALWRGRFEAAWPVIADLGFDARFRRLWRFYLAYCEAGFRVGRVDLLQFALGRE